MNLYNLLIKHNRSLLSSALPGSVGVSSVVTFTFSTPLIQRRSAGQKPLSINRFLDVCYTRDRHKLKQLTALRCYSEAYLGCYGLSQGVLSIVLNRKIKIHYKNSQRKILRWTKITFRSKHRVLSIGVATISEYWDLLNENNKYRSIILYTYKVI
jgi:hypothetical protein